MQHLTNYSRLLRLPLAMFLFAFSTAAVAENIRASVGVSGIVSSHRDSAESRIEENGDEDSRAEGSSVGRRISAVISSGAEEPEHDEELEEPVVTDRAESTADRVAWDIALDQDGHLFPSYLIATATMRVDPGNVPSRRKSSPVLGEHKGALFVTVESPRDDSEVEIQVTASSMLQAFPYRIVLPKAGRTYRIVPKLNWDFEKLHYVKQQIPFNITTSIKVDGIDQGAKTITATLNSINDCPWAYAPSEKETELYTWMAAAYVNENHPWVHTLLKEALEQKLVESFNDYQEETSEKVYLQVYALWKVLHRKGIKYSNVYATATESDKLLVQYVRFLDQSLHDRQANCVDGSVLFASALRKIGLDSYLVSVPEHMFVAFDLDGSGESIVALETTMLGDADAEEYTPLEGISPETLKKLEKDPTWRTFTAAVNAGNAQILEHAEEFKDRDNMEYQVVDIANARRHGINPIAFLE